MPRTNTDLIIELKEAVATLFSRADHVDDAIRRIDMESVRERLTRIEAKLEHLEVRRDRGSDRSWLLWTSIISAIIGAAVGSVATYLLQTYNPNEPPPEAKPGIEQRQRETPL